MKSRKEKEEETMIRRRVAGAVRIFLYALLLAALLAPQLSSPAFADEGEGKEICHFCDKLWDEDELCPTCGTCPECIANNNGVEIHCYDCDECVTSFDESRGGCAASGHIYCDDCLKEEHLHCVDCGDCYCDNPDMLCEECGKCNSCCEDDGEGNQYVCDDCHKCSGCANHCPICGDCQYERCPMELAHCQFECELCPSCGVICFYESDYDPCEYCGLCEACCEENRCPDCGMCSEDPSFDTHFCADCGECLETVPEVCDNCGLCLECCLAEAENLGCTCGEYCFEDVNDEHVCVNCGICFGMIESCRDCGLCMDCCEDVSRIEGCDCDRPVCVESDEWVEHFKSTHAQFAGSHSARPASSWSFDESFHWKDCRYCDEASHITSKASHSFRSGRCTVCGFSNVEPIVISKQPQNRVATVSDCMADSGDPLCSENNRVRFSVAAVGRNLSYTWFSRTGSATPAKFEELRAAGNGASNISYNDTANSNSLVVNVTDDACQDELYSFRCYISDGEHGLWSDVVTLTVEHGFTIVSEDDYEDAGHYMLCHGDGCSEVKLVPHVFTHWEWEDDAHTIRVQNCEACSYSVEVYVHDHVEWVRTFFRGEALFTDANHNYEFDPGTEPDNWHVSGNIGEPGCKASCEDLYGNIWTADWNYHTGWCYCDDCFSNPVKIRELHHFGAWQGADDPEAGILYRFCADCGYTQYATDGNGRPTAWQNGMHPVVYVDCSGPNRLVRAGDQIFFTPDKIPGRVFEGFTIKYYTLVSGTTYAPVTRILGNVTIDDPLETYWDYWEVDDSIRGSGRIEVHQRFKSTACTHQVTEIVGREDAPCGRRGYTGDKVCAYCGQLIEKGEPTEYRAHGNLITVTEDIFRTDGDGNVLYDRSGKPLMIARGPHAPDCATQSNGNEADKICEDCGFRAVRGKSIPWQEGHSFYWNADIRCTDPDHPASNRFKCLKCGEYKFAPEDLNGLDADMIEYIQQWHWHAEVINQAKATCTAYGCSGDVYCPDCGQTIVQGDMTKPTGHRWDSGTVAVSESGNSARIVYTCTVCGASRSEITNIPVTGVKLDKTSLTLTAGDTAALTATVAPENATNKTVTWKSSDSKVASVDTNGKVTAVAAGTATITVTTADGGKTATCTVTVKAATVPVTGVKLDKTSLTLTAGDTATLTATVAPENATNKTVTWKSSDSKVASVDTNGKVTAVAAGTATITVTTADGGKTATCTVTVKAAEISVAGSLSGKTLIYTAENVPAGSKLIVAWYNGGRLVNVLYVSPAEGSSSGDLTVGSDATTYKLMLVNGASYTPLCPVWVSGGQ
jgi:uncharacterized protein YjdB